MKKTLLTAMGAAFAAVSFAQNFAIRSISTSETQIAPYQKEANKTTGNGDTLSLTNIGSQAQGDTLIIPYVWSAPQYGFTSGPNSYGDKGFAERFDFDVTDSSLKVIGAIFYFTGTYNTATTKTITAKAYSQGARTKIGNYTYDGFPSAALASSANVSIKNLGINISGGNDTLTYVPFTAPTAYLTDSFFVGYEISYTSTALGGDTIGLVYTTQGDRDAPVYTTSGTDTFLFVRNAVLGSNNTWVDEFSQNTGLFHNFAIFPVVEVKWTTGVSTLNKGNLSFYGNYPNPATNNTNVKFALKNATEVTITVTDMSGRTISSSTKKYNAGEQIVSIETADLPAGNYICIVRTAENDGVANKFSVVK